MWFEVEYSVCYDVISEPFSFKKEAVKDSKLGFGARDAIDYGKVNVPLRIASLVLEILLLSSFSSKVFAS